MKIIFNGLVSVLLLSGLIALYAVASTAEAAYKPMWTAEFFFYLGLLVLASYYFWKKVLLLTVLKWIFSDLSFPRGVRWLPWWGAGLMLLAAGRAIFWIFDK